MNVRCVSRGLQAGLLGGAAVAAFFFVGDLLSLHPLATPYALSRTVLGPGSYEIEMPVLAQFAAVVAFGSRLLVITVLHFLAFALLGLGAVALFAKFSVPLNLVSGAVYGAVICTSVFYVTLAIADVELVGSVPGFVSVLFANLLAGAVMGGFAQIRANEDAIAI
jgi:hypothetical protein